MENLLMDITENYTHGGLLAIPTLGIPGAGLATGLSMVGWNIWLNTLVVKYLDVDPSIVAALRS